ncbi:GCN5-related N-acetyltransferase [Candidatus Vecturithrix granuli]|uniref:GCN5-related N-acetyltransferase n=1 Tax=Vecturithrix granuli TaxID=1499967 RepID=A0A0S6W954_VECG1|nr:GCN5-related N-acetyltransferase [Candidatus Vecturithrix granuli]
MNHEVEVKSYLNTNAFHYIVHLKMIHAYSEHIVCYYEHHKGQKGVVLLVPTPVVPFDARTYPNSAFIVLLAATDRDVLYQIIRYIPPTENLVFKLVDDTTKEVICQQFPSTRVTAYVSYTAYTQAFHQHAAVVASSMLDVRLLPYYHANGYTPDEMNQYFEQGAMSFTLYDHAHPLSTCFTFQNYERIWEIGGVYTDPAHRGKGYARMVVETALQTLMARQYVPRYQVAETNISSIRVAETLGLTPGVITEHFFYHAGSDQQSI